MKFIIIAACQAFVESIAQYGVVGRALRSDKIDLQWLNLHDFAGAGGRIDDAPYGGGAGCVIAPEPVEAAIFAAKQSLPDARVVYLDPRGEPLRDRIVRQYADLGSLILLAGRYSGVDERVLETSVDERIQVGECVVSGGELPALMLVDAVSRYVDGVLGSIENAEQDGDASSVAGAPSYTRPRVWQGQEVPGVLLNGNHEAIAEWRAEHAAIVKARRMNKRVSESRRNTA